MRLRFGAAMPRKGGRTAIIGVEVRERPGARGRTEHTFTVGSVDRVSPPTVGAAMDRIVELTGALADRKPCVIVDAGTAQGIALSKELRALDWGALHRPHMYPGGGPDREQLFAEFLRAYSSGRIRFRPGLPHRAELDKALVFHTTTGTRTLKTEGVELSSEDEALVLALGLALTWPKHGEEARRDRAGRNTDAISGEIS